MKLFRNANWQSPLDIAAALSLQQEDWVFLYSGMQVGYTGSYSIIALDKCEEVEGGFDVLAKKLSSAQDKWQNTWFGYLGYGLKNQLEKLSEDQPSYINPPDLWFARFATIFVFNHISKEIEIWGEDQTASIAKWETVSKVPNYKRVGEVVAQGVSSNMTRDEYLSKVDNIREAIKRGDIYQANLTRKFYGNFQNEVKPFDIFKDLCSISPAQYSAFIKFGDFSIISSSPERFLKIDANGNVNTRPIKGSGARCPDPIGDNFAKEALANSQKDRAENLMIVDLSRNDIARNCEAGSVCVDELFKIETYATVHHMVSSVSGKKKQDATTLDVIKGCFPPGSMTGTPKIKAMEICSELERKKRGIYSGAIGYFCGDGSADLSVVIRTIITEGNKFDFQVGGAIVNDSEAIAEFNETMTKARGVANALGIPIEKLSEI